MPARIPTRRTALATGLGGAFVLAGPARSSARLGEDGLYQLDWYLDSFLDLAEDIETARKNGKRLAVLWGLRGCPACKRMHEVHLSDPAIEGYVRSNFEVLHLNFVGARPVTDLDGTQLGEKALGERYGIRFTPSIQFFPDAADGLSTRRPQQREAARMPGLLEPKEFLAFFMFVRERGYERATFADWLKARGA